MKKYVLLTVLISTSVWAQTQSPERVMAWKLHNRIAGVPPAKSVLDTMEMKIRQGDSEGAARMAISTPTFINIVMKNWVKTWSNREQSNRIDFNDHTATLIGIIRDDISFDRALYDDVYYTVNGSNSAYAANSNNHYRSAEQQRLDFSNPSVLVKDSQVSRLSLPGNAVAGVVTTRQSASAFMSAGTNRRINRFTFMNFLCNDYEQLHDITVPQQWIGRDVDRVPGGDSRTFLNKCVGCHAGQDSMRGAWAYYDFNNNMIAYTPGQVVNKINKNVNYSAGYMTVNDSWDNQWAIPNSQNQSKLVFRGVTFGNGGKSLNQMFARSEGFANCMAKKVFELVCMKEPVNPADVALVKDQARRFESTGYKMKDLIVKTSVGCIANE